MGLFDAFNANDEIGDFRQADQAKKKGLNQGFEEYEGYVTPATDKAVASFERGIPAWDGISESGQAGIDYYGQLLGLPGSGGPGVQQTLENIPGYQFARDQGIDSLYRTDNSRGMLASGNNSEDIMRFSQGLADQNYFNYLGAVQPYFGLGTAGAAGKQGIYNRIGDAYIDRGNNLGQMAWNKETGIGQSGADMYMNSANAKSAADSNLWGAILGLGSAAASAYGA
jgi:hypothetical protein